MVTEAMARTDRAWIYSAHRLDGYYNVVVKVSMDRGNDFEIPLASSVRCPDCSVSHSSIPDLNWSLLPAVCRGRTYGSRSVFSRRWPVGPTS